MKNKLLFLTACVLALLIACSPGPGNTGEQVADTSKIPDSVPQIVMIGKGGDWAFKPDTSMNELILGNIPVLKKYMHDNGADGESVGDRKVLYYFNARETEVLAVYVIADDRGKIPYGFRLQKNSDSLANNNRPHGYVTDLNFITGHGIYIGMPPDYVQSIYKSQPMTRWVKGDTTYLAYSPSEKDKLHFKRYAFTDYSATYKFVDDKCRVIEMMVKPEGFETK